MTIRELANDSSFEGHGRESVINFLSSIGIHVTRGDASGGFVPGVRIERGGLVVGADARASNLLHEAGHLAVLPRSVRHLANDSLHGAFERLLAETEGLDPESKEAIAAIHCGDPEATAWAWAAGRHLGVEDTYIIEDIDYDGDGASIRLMLKLGRYAGIHGLARAGWCRIPQPLFGRAGGLPQYPALARWVQD